MQNNGRRRELPNRNIQMWSLLQMPQEGTCGLRLPEKAKARFCCGKEWRHSALCLRLLSGSPVEHCEEDTQKVNDLEMSPVTLTSTDVVTGDGRHACTTGIKL